MADASTLGRIVWYELLTSDMKAAGKFYSAVCGWAVEPFTGSPHPYDAFVRAGNVPVGGVMDVPAGMNFPPHWEMYIAVPNIGDAISKIERHGGTSLGPLIDIPSVGKLRTMTDPQGAVFAIIEPVPMEQERPEGEPEIGDGSWHELYTTDAEAAFHFYEEMFGWRATTAMDMGPMGKYQMFGRGIELGGMMKKPPEMGPAPPAWNLYFRVDDINTGAERVKANGGQVLNGPMEVPGGNWIANCMDPQGAAFSIHYKK